MGRAACACVIAFAGGAACAGCAQLFGIDTTSGTGGDAHMTAVTAQVQRITLGPTTTRTAEDVSHLTASWLVADTNAPDGFQRVAATIGDTTDTWTAAIPDGNPPFEFTMAADYPDSFRRLYTFPQRDIKILYGVAEQPNAVAAPPAGAFNVTVNLPTPQATGEAFQLNSLGAWANHGFSAVELAPGVGATKIGPVTVPYAAAGWGSVSGRPLTEITRSDLVIALRYINSYELTGAAEFAPFDQTGGTDAITATMSNNPRAPLDIHVDPPTIASRLAMPAPAGVNLGMAWSVVAAPGYTIANTAGPLLNYGTVLATDTGAVTAPIGNPFVAKDWRSVYTWATSKSRTFVIPALNNQTATLYCGINEIAEVSAGLTVDAPVPLPVLVSINGTPLTTDGQTITLDASKAVVLAMVTDGGSALFYQWNIYELKADANGTTIDPHVVYAALAVDKQVTIPNDVLVAGKVYQMRAHAIQGGYPSFAEGNLWNRNLPYSIAYLDAGIFTVAP